MDPTGLPPGVDELLKLGQVPVGILTLWILYQIAVKLEKVVTRIDTVLELVTGKLPK